jgi:ubiquinone/menaquinone biosynthesis C-methylase UbiE
MTLGYHYAMAVGAEGADRLTLLDGAYGPGTRRVLEEAGLRAGMRVVDLGCGIGSVATWMARQVGAGGSVVGVDFSGEQLEKARERARVAGLTNVEYVEASVYATGLARGSFDLAYCRVVLKHLDRPEDALREMRELLRPGGTIVCEEAVLDTSACEPPSDAHRRLQSISWEMFARMGCQWQVARHLFRLMLSVGFELPNISYYQPVFARGEEKWFELLSFREVAPRIVAKGVATAEEIAAVATAVQRLVEDESVVYSLSRMTQIWARK